MFNQFNINFNGGKHFMAAHEIHIKMKVVSLYWRCEV